MSIFNQTKKKEKEEKSERISAFENEINNAFALMNKAEVGRIVLAARVIHDEELVQAKKEHAELFYGWVDTSAKIYYPSKFYGNVEIGPVNNNRSYALMSIVSGTLSKERIKTPYNAEEIKGDGKEGFELIKRYFSKPMSIIANHNQNYVTMIDFLENAPENTRRIAEVLAGTDISPEELRKGISVEIEYFKNKASDNKK